MEIIKYAICGLWKVTQAPKILDMKTGFILLRFATEKDAFLVLMGGSWIFQGQAIQPIPWRSDFQTLIESMCMAPIRL